MTDRKYSGRIPELRKGWQLRTCSEKWSVVLGIADPGEGTDDQVF